MTTITIINHQPPSIDDNNHQRPQGEMRRGSTLVLAHSELHDLTEALDSVAA